MTNRAEMLLVGAVLSLVIAAILFASIVWDLRGMSSEEMARRLEMWTHRNPEQFLAFIGCVGLLAFTIALCAAKSFEVKDHAVRDQSIARRLDLVK